MCECVRLAVGARQYTRVSVSSLSLRQRIIRKAKEAAKNSDQSRQAGESVSISDLDDGNGKEELDVVLEHLEDDRVKLVVTISASDFEPEIDKAFRKLAKDVRLPGFRPGKAPRKLLEARLGLSAGRHEAIQDCIPDYYRRAVIAKSVDAIDSPSLEVLSGEDSGDLIFQAIVPVRPIVVISGYAELTVEVPAPSATDAEVDGRLEVLRRQHGELEVVVRPAADGDQVTIDIEGIYEGEPVEGLTATDYLYEVGTGAVVAVIDSNLRGAIAGDHLEFEADHPDEEGVLLLRITLKEVQELVLPEADDEFASQVSEFTTIEELAEDLRSDITDMKKSQASTLAREYTARAVAELVTSDIPDILVEAAIDERLRDMAMRMAQQGVDLSRWMEATGQDIGAFREGFREDAGISARADLGLRAVAIAEGLEPGDTEIEAHLEMMVGQVGQTDVDLAELHAGMVANGHMLEIKGDLRKTAAMDWLCERVNFVDEEGNSIDRSVLTPPETWGVVSKDSELETSAEGRVEEERSIFQGSGEEMNEDLDQSSHQESFNEDKEEE